MTKKTETTEPKSKYALVNLILRKLGLSDEGILDKFFDKQVKRLKRDIKTSEQNINAVTSNYEVAKDELVEQIEDAEEAVIEAYTAIDPTDLKSNAAINEFEESYWMNIRSAERVLAAYKEQLQKLKDQFKDEIDAIKLEMKEFNESIDIIENFKRK